jgi:hypothetical protein
MISGFVVKPLKARNVGRSEWQWAFVPDGPRLDVVAEPSVTPVGGLGAAAKRLGDLGPGRTVVKGPVRWPAPVRR